MSHMSDLDVQRQIRETDILMELGWTEDEAQDMVEAGPIEDLPTLHDEHDLTTDSDAQSLDVYEDTAGRYLDEPEVLYGDADFSEDYYDSGIDF